MTYEPKECVFSQGDASDSVKYVQAGTVKLSVLSGSGQEAVVAMLETGAFFGESAMLDDSVRHHAATAMTAATVLSISKARIVRLLREQHEFSRRFIAHLLVRNIRLEEDILDQMFNSTERRLARALLLLYGHASKTYSVRPQVSQQMLADMVGTTRSRVNLFMRKFKRLGYIDYSGGLLVNDSLAAVVLAERAARGAPSRAGLSRQVSKN